MEKGSKAENVVQGYPTTAENYEKAFDSLKNRFGRDDLLVEYYTRELLSLVLQNAMNKGKKTSVSDVFDKISAHIRALETLGVATDNCAIMLYPLVESSLPEEILRTWQRSAMNNATPADGVETTDRLTKLLKFLEAEVKNEGRITMAVNGFTMQTENEKRERTRGTRGKTDSTQEMATASALLSTEEKRNNCIFCKDNHENAACDKAKKLSFDVRKNIVKENSCCFKCLKRGHRSRDCRVRLSCGWCGNRHVILFCPDLCNNSNNLKSNKIESPVKNKVVEQNLASFCSLPDRNGKLVVFRHKRVVYGLTCSPFILGAVLEYHFLNIARAVTEKYYSHWSKEIIKRLSKSFYVDNCTTSVKSTAELNKFISVSKDVMKQGGFDLRGWEYTHDTNEEERSFPCER